MLEQNENKRARGRSLDQDGLMLDEVGVWAKEKHERLRKYIDISHAARRKFVEGRGGATYIDLFCGAGKAIIRETLEKIDGSPIVAFKCARDSKVPFSKFFIADASSERCKAACQRLRWLGASPETATGEAEVTVKNIVSRLDPHGLHFAFLDPYKLDALPFSVIEELSRLKRIDLLIHVSALDLQRNFDLYTNKQGGPLDRFAPGWRAAVDLRQTQQSLRAAYIRHWAKKMETIGLPPVRYELVSGKEKNQRLYWLVFVSKSDFARGLWEKIRNLSGQGDLL